MIVFGLKEAKSRWLLLLLVLFMGIGNMSLFAQFSGGEGTEETPWLIANIADLNAIRGYIGSEHSDKYFVQTADIDLRGIANWSPIGSSSLFSFRGHYDGGNYLLTNLTLNRPESSFQGLFGYTVYAGIKNVGLVNVNVTAADNTGSLIGNMQGGVVDGCFVTGKIQGIRNVGGLVGNKGGVTSSLTNSYTVAEVTGRGQRVGGLVGFNQEGQVRFCYASGLVISSLPAGVEPQIGALIGVWGTGVVSNNYWNSETTGLDRGCFNLDIPARTTLQMMRRNTYMAWDFPAVWQLVNEQTMPYLVWSGEAAPHNYPPLLAPQQLRASAGNQRVVLNWQPGSVGEPDGYNVYRSTGEQQPVRINQQPVVNAQFTDEALANNTKYRYFVRAIYDADESLPSLPVYSTPFAIGGGTGTAQDPYLVSTPQHLNVVRIFLQPDVQERTHFRQTADIDLAGWNNGNGWAPLGDEDRWFAGVYDGNNFAVKNLFVAGNGNYQGLFGHVRGGELKNIKVQDVRVSGAQSYAGGLAGYIAENSVITNSSSLGQVSGINYVGGLVGYQHGSTISKSFAGGSVTAFDSPSHVGGLVGYKTNVASVIENCYSTAGVSGSERNAGGLVGTNWNGLITKSYATGSVFVTNYDGATGGLVGHFQTGEVTYSYWNVQTTGQEASPGGGEGKTTQQMMQQATFQPAQGAWDFADIWGISQNQAYPFLRWQGTSGVHNRPGPYDLAYQQGAQENDINLSWQMMGAPLRYHLYRNGSRIASINHPTRQYQDNNRTYFTEYSYHVVAIFQDGAQEIESVPSNRLVINLRPAFAGGTGSILNPYRVNSAATLRLVADSLHAHFIQTANIDLGVAPYNTGDGWAPIGTEEAGRRFTGSFDGNGFTISNLYINRNQNYQGLFGYVQGGVLEDITLSNTNVAGNQYVGALAGYFTGEAIDCNVSGTIRSSSNYVGGVFGYASADISGCTANVNVTGNGSYVGGFVGWLLREAVNCSVRGYVSGTGSYIGGLAGYNQAEVVGCSADVTVESASSYIGGLLGFSSNTVVNSSAAGSIRGYRYIGGLVGYTNNDTIIRQCSSTASVYGTYREIGGLVGYSRGLVERSYATGAVLGDDRHIGGLVGYKRYGNANAIRDSYAMGNVTSTSTNNDADVGGLVGYHFEGEITNSYSTGSVTGVSNLYAGGLIGRQEANATTANSFWNTESSGRANSAGGTGRTTTQMFQSATFTGANWDFNEIWAIQQNQSYPYLRWQDDFGHNRPAPRNLSLQAGNRSVQLNWSAPLQGQPEGYRVYRNGTPVNPDQLITQTQYNDTQLMNYREYTYYVKAVYNLEQNIQSGPSNSPATTPLRGSFTSGNGTAAAPFEIDSAGALWEMRRYLGAANTNIHFRQTANIDLGVEPFTDGQGWLPIGDGLTAEQRFYATFNGNGFKISDMTISRGGSDYVGLIGYLMNASVQNVVLDNVDIQGRNYTGGLTGYINNAPITNTSVTGSIRGGSYSGGITGFLTGAGSTVSGCYAIGQVSGTSFIGGLIGYTAITNSVANCYAAASVFGSTYVGGLIGDSRSNVTFSFSTGLVRGTGTDIGPFAGRVAAGSIAQNCYWNFETSGHLTTPGTVFGGHSRSALQMIQQANYDGWNFAATWTMGEGTYPYLRWQEQAMDYNYPPPIPPSNLLALIGSSRIELNWNTPSLGNPLGYKVFRSGLEIARIGPAQSYRDASATNNIQYTYHLVSIYSDDRESLPSNSVTAAPVSGGFAGGRGTVDDPYQVATPAQLDGVRYNPSMHYIQTANINLSGYRNWEPIGQSSTIWRFNGTYDGGNNIITNLRKTGTTSYSGMFGYTDGATLKNIAVENANVSGGSFSGVIVGYARETLIDNCYAIGTLQSTSIYVGGLGGYVVTNSVINNSFADVEVTGSPRYAGGLIGANSGSPINNSFSFGDVSTASTSTGTYLGGLVGYNMSTVTNSYATGNVTAPQPTGQYIGGLTGRSTGTITASFATGNVTGNQWIAGLVGYNSSTVSNSYATGSITGNSDIGGFIGDNRSTVTNCYAMGRVFGQGENVGGFAGNNTSNIATSYWNTQTSGLNVSAGAEGRTTEEMTYPYAANTYMNWNFTNLWVADIERTYNSGYPFHSWRPMTISPVPAVASNPSPADEADNVSLTLNRVEWDYRSSVLYQNPVGFRVYMNTTGEFDEDSPYHWVNFVNGQVRYASTGALPEDFEYGTVYYWQVIPTTINPNRNSEGDDDYDRKRRSLHITGGRSATTVRGDAVNCPVWTFRTIPHPIPYVASHPNPADEAVNVPASLEQLQWRYVKNPAYTNPVGFRVYLGEDEEFGEDYQWVAYDEEETAFSLELEGMLEAQATYYWQVVPTTTNPNRSNYSDADNLSGRKQNFASLRDRSNLRGDAENCPVWSFTTREPSENPTIASNPNPEDGAEEVSLELENLSWQYLHDTEYALPVGFKIYFDTTGEFDEDATFMWVPYNEHLTNYQTSMLVDLLSETTYYWQVVPTTIEFSRTESNPARKTARLHLLTERSGIIIRGDAEDCPVWSFTTEYRVSVADEAEVPLVTKLTGNYPNPFNPETTISFNLAEEGGVVLQVFNVKGQLVRTLLNENKQAGRYRIVWNGKDDHNRSLGTGVYYYRLKCEDYSSTNRMLMMK